MRRQIIIILPVEFVADADLQFLEAVEHVELGEGDAGDAGYGHRLADQHRIEPAATALAPGDRAELMAARAKPLADRIVLLGRERARADARRISLGDTEHIA